MLRRSQSQFNIRDKKSGPKGTVGGAKPVVQASAEALADRPDIPMLAARIYSPPSMKHYDDSDPRFAGKSDMVENIYLPAETVQEAPRSGIMQIFNWLTKGRME